MNISKENLHCYITTILRMVLQWDSRRWIVLWRGIPIDRITNGVTIRICLSVNLSIILIYDMTFDPSLPFPRFYIFLVYFFLQKIATSSPFNLNTTQPPTTFLVTTIFGLSASVFWFKFYWGFSILSMQIYIFLFEHNFKILIFFYIFL